MKRLENASSPNHGKNAGILEEHRKSTDERGDAYFTELSTRLPQRLCKGRPYLGEYFATMSSSGKERHFQTLPSLAAPCGASLVEGRRG